MEVLDRPVVVRHRLTVDGYYKMAETGVLAPDDRVELIDGEVIEMAPIGSRHGGTVKQLVERLTPAVAKRAVLSVQDPIRLGAADEPQPDIALLRPRTDFYKKSHPTASDVLLIVEVAETSARYDREIKVPLYAKHGVPEVWIVDLEAGLVRFYRQPVGERYTDITATETPGPTPVDALPGIAIDLTDVL